MRVPVSLLELISATRCSLGLTISFSLKESKNLTLKKQLEQRPSSLLIFPLIFYICFIHTKFENKNFCQLIMYHTFTFFFIECIANFTGLHRRLLKKCTSLSLQFIQLAGAQVRGAIHCQHSVNELPWEGGACWGTVSIAFYKELKSYETMEMSSRFCWLLEDWSVSFVL